MSVTRYPVLAFAAAAILSALLAPQSALSLQNQPPAGVLDGGGLEVRSNLLQNPTQDTLSPLNRDPAIQPGRLGNFVTPWPQSPGYGWNKQQRQDGSPQAGWSGTTEDLGAGNPFFSGASSGQQDEDGKASPWPAFDRDAFGLAESLDELDKEASRPNGEPEEIESPETESPRRTFETSGRVDVIRQRYPDGKVQIERQVTQDREGNYYSHGTWKLFSPQATTLADGTFQFGLMEGPWRRWHSASREGVFAMQPFDQFTGPFLSTVNFTGGKLDGLWQIHDSSQRKIMELAYELGRRQGTATWWWPSGTKMREIRFDRNLIDGYWIEWDAQGKVTRRDEFIRGRQLIRETEEFRPGQPQYLAWFVAAKLSFDGEDNWWDARPAAYQSAGERIQHGPVALWYENGQPMMQGQFRAGVRHGTFTWWHANGQKKLSGQFDRGKKTGTWTWWHESGMKSTEGNYGADEPEGLWIWWDTEGQVTQRKMLGSATGDQPELTEPGEPTRGDLPASGGDLPEATENPPELEEIPIDDGTNPIPEVVPSDSSPPSSPDAETPPLIQPPNSGDSTPGPNSEQRMLEEIQGLEQDLLSPPAQDG